MNSFSLDVLLLLILKCSFPDKTFKSKILAQETLPRILPDGSKITIRGRMIKDLVLPEHHQFLGTQYKVFIEEMGMRGWRPLQDDEIIEGEEVTVFLKQRGQPVHVKLEGNKMHVNDDAKSEEEGEGVLLAAS